MNFLGGLLSGLFNAAANLGTTAFKTSQQKQLMEKAYDIWSKQQTNAFKLNKQGMLDAGINPAVYFGGSGGWKVSN